MIGSMRSMRGLRPRDENNFAVMRSDQLVEMFNTFIGVFFLIMLALSSVGLLVGGIGVIGIMMISVTERTREIGVRKAVGATRQEIMWQFLVESAVLTLLGGVAGLVLGSRTCGGSRRLHTHPRLYPAVGDLHGDGDGDRNWHTLRHRPPRIGRPVWTPSPLSATSRQLTDLRQYQ